ncbi:hypothetical protein VTP01DRAFT_7697 [Rhizomucor pusillus]|uniref:uncharacterized protein n=1 Tax=Rhizomucor pusillus TaxID=4840 RepID=UPI0037446FD0
MKRFTSSSESPSPPVDLVVDSTPVHFVGPATQDNPMSHVRTKLMGKVVFHDRKIKWNRITLQLAGRAGLNISTSVTNLPRDVLMNMSDLNGGVTNLQTTVAVCDVEKELIFTGAPVIDFGIHLPSHLPPSIKAKHAFVEYTLVATFSAGSFFKKYKRVDSERWYHGIKDWFEWTAEVPKAAAIECGEVVLALRWSVEKERVEVDRIELALEEIETYRFSTKSGIHSLPPFTTSLPPTTYHPPTFSASSETHFIRTPILINNVRPHHFDPFLEISHQCRLTFHFRGANKPMVTHFPIIITDFPPSQELRGEDGLPLHHIATGDDAVHVDVDLPEYTPRYEQIEVAE